MNRIKKLVSLLMLAALMLTMSVTASAAEKKVAINGSKDGYMVISGYDSEVKPGVFLASSPVKVTFYGTDLTVENVNLLPKATCDASGNVTTNVTIDNIETSIVVIPQDVENLNADSGLYGSDNNVTLTGGGIYNIFTGPESVAVRSMTNIFIVISIPSVTATPTPSTVLVNGVSVSFDAYMINGSNYFKLRDLAKALSGSTKQFNVSWSMNMIWITPGRAYIPVGGELTKTGSTASKSATLTTSPFYIDVVKANLTAYKIGGSNYFRLRDLGQALDFGVTWDGKQNTISIDTSIKYNADSSAVTDAAAGNGAVIGIVGNSVSTVAKMLQMWPSGVYVSSLANHGPAELAGIKSNDIITSIGGKPVASTEDMKAVLAALKPGEVVIVAIYRPGDSMTTVDQELTLSVTLKSVSDGYTDVLAATVDDSAEGDRIAGRTN